MRSGPAAFDQDVLAALQQVVEREEARKKTVAVRSVTLALLLPGHVLAGPILTTDGRLLLRESYPISQVVLERVRNLARLHGVQEPILIQDDR
jgi:hypothetical protein